MPRLKSLVCPTICPKLEEKNWIHTLPKGINVKYKQSCLGLNSFRDVQFLRWYPLHHEHLLMYENLCWLSNFASTFFLNYFGFSLSLSLSYPLPQSAGAVEYTNCIIKAPPTSILNMALNNLMVKPQTWRFGEYGVPLYCHRSQVNSSSV